MRKERIFVFVAALAVSALVASSFAADTGFAQPALPETPESETTTPEPPPTIPPPPSRKDIRDVVIALDENVATLSSEEEDVEKLNVELEQLSEAIAEQENELASGLDGELQVERGKLSDFERELAGEQFVLGRNKRKLGRIATDVYMSKGDTLPDSFVGLDNFSTYRLGQTLEVSISNLRGLIEENEQKIDEIEESIDRQKGSMAELEAEVAGIKSSLTENRARKAEVENEIANKTVRSTELRSANIALQADIVRMLKLVGSPANSGSDPSIAVMGEPVLTAEQLTEWFRATRGNLQVGQNDVAELASLYIEEGRSLGVRGDVAFVQAVLETGNFAYTGKNNFAGIGHCDSCERGYPFATPREGVRAQIQLLRSYADKDVTSADFPGGAQPGINPERLGVRGCCVSWWGLTGVWATALHYGGTILKMYDEAVLYSLRNQEVLP